MKRSGPSLFGHLLAWCLGALALLVLAIVFDSAWITFAAAAVGGAGAIAFCVFFFVLLRRMRAPVR